MTASWRIAAAGDERLPSMAAAGPGGGAAELSRGPDDGRSGLGLEALPDSARIWIFGVDPALSAAGAQRFLQSVDRFLAGWTAHGAPLRAGRSLRCSRFLVVGVDDAATPPSGCAIDALARATRASAEETGARVLGNETVWYRDAAGDVVHATRPAFRREAAAGRASGSSVVFDNAIQRLGELRAGRWEGPAAERWHAALLP